MPVNPDIQQGPLVVNNENQPQRERLDPVKVAKAVEIGAKIGTAIAIGLAVTGAEPTGPLVVAVSSFTFGEAVRMGTEAVQRAAEATRTKSIKDRVGDRIKRAAHWVEEHRPVGTAMNMETARDIEQDNDELRKELADTQKKLKDQQEISQGLATRLLEKNNEVRELREEIGRMAKPEPTSTKGTGGSEKGKTGEQGSDKKTENLTPDKQWKKQDLYEELRAIYDETDASQTDKLRTIVDAANGTYDQMVDWFAMNHPKFATGNLDKDRNSVRAFVNERYRAQQGGQNGKK